MDSMDIILLCGLYGAGKTKFAKQHFLNSNRFRISRSEIRKNLFEMAYFGKKWTAEAFSEDNDFLVKHVERKILEHILHHKQKSLIINTFVSTKSRKRFINIAKERKIKIGAIFLNPPIETCLEKNETNAINVPSNVLYILKGKLELPAKSEGFDKVIIIDTL